MTEKLKNNALFITFEGGEGSGKSTHIKQLEEYLKDKEFKTAVFHEPGSTHTGEKIRQLLLDCKNNINPEAELFLYLSARAQFVKEKLIPALNEYDAVLCDRYEDSTLVYQGCGLNLGMDKIFEVVKFASENIEPDLTFFLDVEPKTGLSRIREEKDRIEQRDLDFHNSLREGYKTLARNNPKRIKIIETGEINQTFNKILKFIDKYVEKNGNNT